MLPLSDVLGGCVRIYSSLHINTGHVLQAVQLLSFRNKASSQLFIMCSSFTQYTSLQISLTSSPHFHHKYVFTNITNSHYKKKLWIKIKWCEVIIKVFKTNFELPHLNEKYLSSLFIEALVYICIGNMLLHWCILGVSLSVAHLIYSNDY